MKNIEKPEYISIQINMIAHVPMKQPQMWENSPDSKVHGANMGPIWGQQDPGGPHVGHVNLAIWDH